MLCLLPVLISLCLSLWACLTHCAMILPSTLNPEHDQPAGLLVREWLNVHSDAESASMCTTSCTLSRPADL